MCMSHCSFCPISKKIMHLTVPTSSHLIYVSTFPVLIYVPSTQLTLDKVFKDLKIASATPSCPHFTLLLSSFLTPYFNCLLPLSWSSFDLPGYSFSVPCVGSPPSMPLFNGEVSQGLVFGPLLFLFTSIHH